MGVFEISDLKLTKSLSSFLFFKIIISFTEILKENKENEKKILKEKSEKIVEFKFD